MSVKISLITFTRNSEKLIEGLLRNVNGVVDEVVVVDGCSSDRTVEIARSYGAKVYTRRPWGYKDSDVAFAINKASYDWILLLDVDKRLNRRLRGELKDVLSTIEGEWSVVEVARANISNGRLLYELFWPDRQIRLFKKGSVEVTGIIHGYIKPKGKKYRLPIKYYILHLAPPASLSKLVNYTRYEALEYFEFRRKCSSIRRDLIIKGVYRLAPLTTPLHVLSLMVNQVTKYGYLNVPTLRALLTRALYDNIVHTLIKTRGKRKTRIARLIEEKGIVRLSSLDREDPRLSTCA
jgi:glycosyltransferase involved in cell wall biosynthesis